MWRTTPVGDTTFDDILLVCLESFYDAPVGAGGQAVSAYLGGFLYDYGQQYLRYNGIMNPATSMSPTDVSPTPIADAGPTHGNAFPMFGTGAAMYAQLGYYWPAVIGTSGVMPYVSAFQARWDRLGQWFGVYNIGASVLMDEHRSKFSIDLQNRPTFGTNAAGQVVAGTRMNQLVLQYQLAI
jgi:hypothetical protein